MGKVLTVLGLVSLAGLCASPVRAAESAVEMGCGWSGEPVVCSGYPNYNNAACNCKVTGGGAKCCLVHGWHHPIIGAMDWYQNDNGWVTYYQERPCAYRAKCAITGEGTDNECGCLQPVPGCQFWGDTFAVPSYDMRPYYYTYWEEC